jgi:hypothetical protein
MSISTVSFGWIFWYIKKKQYVIKNPNDPKLPEPQSPKDRRWHHRNSGMCPGGQDRFCVVAANKAMKPSAYKTKGTKRPVAVRGSPAPSSPVVKIGVLVEGGAPVDWGIGEVGIRGSIGSIGQTRQVVQNKRLAAAC